MNASRSTSKGKSKKSYTRDGQVVRCCGLR
jgi:hypothetical protein